MSTLVARSVADFAYDLHTGEHDEVLDNILQEKTPDTVDWVDEQSNWPAFKELSNQLNMHKTLVSVSEDPPPQSSRVLKKVLSDALDGGCGASEAQAERAQVWKDARNQRAKVAVAFISGQSIIYLHGCIYFVPARFHSLPRPRHASIHRFIRTFMHSFISYAHKKNPGSNHQMTLIRKCSVLHGAPFE